MKKIILTLVLLVTPACVSKSEHKSLVEAFDAYYQHTKPLVDAEIAEIGSATPATAALSQTTQGWLNDATTALQKHKERAGLAEAPK